MANEYLKRTPTSTGNRKVFTWSGWVKRNALGSFQGIFSSVESDGVLLVFTDADKIRIGTQSSDFESSSATFRDVGSWMHILLAIDTTLPSARYKVYVNGITVLSGVTNVSINDTVGPANSFTTIFDYSYSLTQNLEGEAFDVFFVDGQALKPDVFGFYKDGDGYMSSGTSNATDFKPGQWMPHSPRKIKSEIESKGGFGANGFYLPMNDSSNPGADFHCAPNSIIKLKGEDLPQPQNGAPTTSDAYVSQLRTQTGELFNDGVVDFTSTHRNALQDSGNAVNLGTGEFTVEAFVYHSDIPQNSLQYIFMNTSQSNINTFAFAVENDRIVAGVWAGSFSNSTKVEATFPVGSLKPGRWYHYAACRSGNTLRLFIDGKMMVEDTSHTENYNNTSQYGCRVGCEAGAGATVAGYKAIKGFISNVRVVNGTALYTSNFTPPTEPLTNVTNTILLCCQSPTSPTAATVSPGTLSVLTEGNGLTAARNELEASIVLAIPGITGGQGSGYGDYSADIKGSGTNKTITANNNATVSATASYYGSAMAFDGTTDSFQYTVPDNDVLFLQKPSFTIECWVYPNTSFTDDRYMLFLGNGSASNSNSCYYLRIYDTYYQGIMANSNNQYATTSANAYVPEQWNHVAYVREGNEQRLYINGVCETVTTHSISPNVNSSSTLYIGSAHGLNNSINAQIQDVRIYDGVVKYKGSFDVSKPYTPVGIEAFRTTTDTCKNNFATLNPLSYQTTGTYGTSYPVLTDGNLKFTHGQTGQWERSNCTMGAGVGKWYFEFRKVAGAGLPGSYENWAVGLRESDGGLFYQCTDGFEFSADHVYWLDAGTAKIVSNESRGSGSTSGILDVVNGDIINVAFEKTATNLKAWFGKNGTYFNSGNPATGANPAVNHSTTTQYIIPSAAFYQYAAQTEPVGVLNFGQNPSFSGGTTAGTNADTSGKGLFKYAPPSGFLALCEDNLPTPAIADPGKHFKTVLWSGSGSSRGITGVGFKPDFVWIKEKSSTSSHALFDSVRGAGVRLITSSTNAEQTAFVNVYNPSFNNDGFGVGTDGAVNQSGQTYVAWCWKAGGAAVPNNEGSIISEVSANQTAGFSIVSYTGNQTSGATVGHGLAKTPKMVIVKERTPNTNNWPIYHVSLGNTKAIYLDLTNDAGGNFTGAWNNTTPTSSLITLGNSNETNRSGSPYIAYCWSEVEGYSKFGTYVGNGAADGSFIYCGFKPAWVLIKRNDNAQGGYWTLFDNARRPYNVNNYTLNPDREQPEVTNGGNGQVDFLSNGFKCKNNDGGINGSAGNYIFAAFAESPFKTANAK